MVALTLELGTAVTAMHVTLAAALLGDRGDASEGLKVRGGLVAVSLGAQAGQEARGEDGASAGQAGEEVVIGMVSEGLLHLGIELSDGLDHASELAADELNAEDEIVDQGAFVGQGHGFCDEVQALSDEVRTAGAVDVIEGLQGGRFGFLDRPETGPAEEEVGGQGTPEFFATQVECLRKVLFEKGLEAIGEAGAFVDDGAAVEDGLLESTRLRTFRTPGFESVVVGEEQLGQVFGILGIILGPAGDEGLTELLEGDGIDGVKRDPGVVLEEEDEVDGGLFEANGDAGFGVIVAQRGESVVEVFRGDVEGLAPTQAAAGVDREEVGFVVGPVKPDNQVIGMWRRCTGVCFHGFSVWLALPQA